MASSLQTVRLSDDLDVRSGAVGFDLADWLTVERAAYAAVALVALLLRLVGLGWFPLGPAEAAQALPALAAAAGKPFDLAGVSPLLFSLQRLLFTPLAANDALARAWPALLSGLAVLLFYPLRGPLGRGGALMAALLWALSPMAVFTGRLALGAGLVPTLALALLAAVAGLGSMTAGRLTAAGGTLGLLLAAGPGAYTALLAAVVAAFGWRSEVRGLWTAVRATRGRRNGLLAGLMALVLGSTFLLTTPNGLAAAADLLGTWARNLVPGAGEYGAWDLVRRLLISELLLVPLGLAGAVRAVRRGDRFGQFAALAAGIALLVPLIGRGRHPADLGLVVLPLSLLGGPVLAGIARDVWAARRDAEGWLLAAISLALLIAAVTALPGAPNTANREDWRQLYATVGTVTLTLAVLVWLVYGVWGSWATVARMAPLVLLIFGLAWNVGQVVGLNYDRGAGRRAAVVVETVAPDLEILRSDLLDISAQRGTGKQEGRVDLVVPVQPTDPLAPTLRWALRDYPNLRIAVAVPLDPAPVVVTVAEPQPRLEKSYSGAEFAVLERWRPESLRGTVSWMRWLLYREANTPADVRKVVLWVDRRAE